MRFNSITVADHPEAWRNAGFNVVDDQVVIGKSLVFNLVGTSNDGSQGVIGWEIGIEGENSSNYSPETSISKRRHCTPPEGEHIHSNGVKNCMSGHPLRQYSRIRGPAGQHSPRVYQTDSGSAG